MKEVEFTYQCKCGHDDQWSFQPGQNPNYDNQQNRKGGNTSSEIEVSRVMHMVVITSPPFAGLMHPIAS